ncbi:hypothetical protein I4J24_11985, partial [Corynebacterium diphtheriae bv. mitis]|nr:hypothetical protein [Corynebacterium diphtheriae bv. mitis]
LPARGAFIAGLDGLGFDDGDIAMFCGTADGKGPSILCHARTPGELINAL